MFRITIVSVFALAAAVAASAGQIQIGGLTGLTSSYVNTGNCGGNCTDQYNYDEVLFQGLDGTTPSPGTHYTQTGPTVNSTLTDTNANAQANGNGAAGIKFSMINDGVNGLNCTAIIVGGGVCNQSNNYWALAGDGNIQEMTIPVGVYGVSQVWSMINSEFAGDNSTDRSVTMFLNFGTAGGTIEDTVRVNLTNTNDTSTGSGQVGNAIICASIAPCSGVATPAGGPLQSTNPTTLTANGVSVSSYADNLYSIKYNGTGNLLVLNDQGLNLGTLNFAGVGTNLNTYLVNVEVEEVGNTSFPGEYAAVSALTVVTAAPEPSTVVMFLTGLGAIGFAGFSRRKA
jgi:hypothetical protein